MQLCSQSKLTDSKEKFEDDCSERDLKIMSIKKAGRFRD